MEYKFCRRCGTELNKVDGFYNCKNNHHTYPSATPTAGVLFFRNEKLVLGRRAIEPNKNKLDTIGGFVDINETFEDAMHREIKEETGLNKSQYTKLEYLCSAYGPYEYQSETKQVLSVFFMSHIKEGAEILPSDDISEVIELGIDEIDFNDIGNEDVKIALEVLRGSSNE